jgi:hypothetical protein
MIYLPAVAISQLSQSVAIERYKCVKWRSGIAWFGLDKGFLPEAVGSE